MNKKKVCEKDWDVENKVLILYKDKRKELMWGFVDAAVGKPQCDILVYDWVHMHDTVLNSKEIEDFFVEERAFRCLTEKRWFKDKFQMFEVTRFADKVDCALAKFERELYMSVISEWYQMYQNVIIAGHMFSPLFDHGNNGTFAVNIDRFSQIAETLYDEVHSEDAFMAHLSTSYIKNALVLHPDVALADYTDEHDRLELFRYQLFNGK